MNDAMREALEAFANPQHWAIRRDAGEPSFVWIGTYRETPIKVAEDGLAAQASADPFAARYRAWAEGHEQDVPDGVAWVLRFLGECAGSPNREWLQELVDIAVEQAQG